MSSESQCIPEIEVEKKTSFINYVSKTLSDKLNEKIIIAASYILNKDYEELLLHEAGRKNFNDIQKVTDKQQTRLKNNMEIDK